MRPRGMEMVQINREDPGQVAFVHDQNSVEQLTAQGSDHVFADRIRLGRCGWTRCARCEPCSTAISAEILRSTTASTLGEVHGQDGVGLCGQELALGRTRPARRGINTGLMQDLPHPGGGDAMTRAGPAHPARAGAPRTSRSAARGGVSLSGGQPVVPGLYRGRCDR